MLLPVALLVEYTPTDYASGTEFLPLVDGFEMCLVNTLLSRTFEDHLADRTLQTVILH